MKATNVTVHNYRSIHDANYRLDGYSLLIGANNAGKSTLVNAIRSFYEKDGFKYDKKKDYPFDLQDDKERESWIDIEFSLEQDEYDNLSDDYKLPPNKLKVRRYFETSEFKTHDNKDASGQIFGYKSDGKLKNEPFYGAKNVQSGKFGTLVYIPAISKVDDHTKLSGPSVLRDLITGILSGVDGSDVHFKKLGDSFTEFAGNMQSSATGDGRSVQAVEDSLNTMISEWGIGFKLNWTPPSLSDVIKSMINPVYTDLAHDKDIAVTDVGSGFQRQLIYSIIKVGADFAAKQPKIKKETFEPDLTWIIFEEPEAFLHPPQQNELARSLQSLSRLDATQVLATTHSSYFVSNNLQVITGMARIAKDNKGISELYQVSDADWQEITDNNKLISQLPAARGVNQDDLKPEMEAIKYSIYLNPDRASMFFAKRVLIVEGPTEVALIHKLVDDGKINPKIAGNVIIDAIGKFNIHRFMNLLTKLGIEHSVLRDEDPGKQLQTEINQLINNSKTPLPIAIDELSPDLEGYLSLPAPVRPDRKPQNAIFAYVNDNVDGTKLIDFCKIIEKLLS
jgi:putative ATP-dependent endonuclease of OLD family